MESYQVSLVTVSQQTSYDSGILRQDDRIIPCLPMYHFRFADCVGVVHLSERTKTGGPNYLIGPDCADCA